MATVLITGGHKGLGLEAARYISSVGGTDLVLAGRNPAEMAPVAADLQARYNVNVRTLSMDVSSLQSVRKGAGEFKAMLAKGDIGPLRALLLNAGMQSLTVPTYSVDGFEKTFATNCLGHFLLLNLLLDDLEKGGRVVFTGSGTHDPKTMDGKMVGKAAEPDADALANDGKMAKPLAGGTRYSTSKLCDILYSYELARRLKASDRDVVSIAYDPGFVPETGLSRSAPAFAQKMARSSVMKLFFKMIGVTPGDLAFSGEGLGRIAIDPAFASTSGRYIQSSNRTLKEARSSEVSYDPARASKLWRDSVRLVKLAADEEPTSIR